VKSNGSSCELVLESPTPPNKSNRQRTAIEPSPQQVVLYKAYPRHVAPQDAYRAIEKALKVRAFDDLLVAVQNWSRKCAREGKEEQYIPHPATWFNAGRYDDEEFKPGYQVKPNGATNGKGNGFNRSPQSKTSGNFDEARAALLILAGEEPSGPSDGEAGECIEGHFSPVRQ
jgi:hypothetical protein